MIDTSVSLRRIDPDKGMARFYALWLQPDLFGGCQLIRAWGRIGQNGGTERHEFFSDGEAAQERLTKLEAAKRRRGYC